MPKGKTFTFRLSEVEMKLLSHLADFLKRTKSDTIRYLIHQALDLHGINMQTIKQNQGETHDRTKEG